MSTDLDSQGGQPPRLMPPERRPPPRVTPPPRLTPPSPVSGAPRPALLAGGATGGLAKWLTAALFGILAVAAIAVFAVLPDWVRDRQQMEVAAASAEPPLTLTLSPKGRGNQTSKGDDESVVPKPLAPALSATGRGDRSTEGDGDAKPATTKTTTPARRPAARRSPAPLPKVDDGFARAMSEGLAALDRRDYAAAREAFARAAAIQPESEQSADGLARAEAGARLAAITALRNEARDLESREDWHAAKQRYEAILEIDPAVALAIDGLARSGRRAELADRLTSHLAKPQRLSSDEVLEEASAILEQASAIAAPSPKLEQQTEQLARLVQAYSTPVTATLESDQLTEVVVYKVGRLGTFDRRDLALRPGSYTVVGSRRGYRDVRRQLVIEPGVAPEPLAIRCEERI